MESLNLPPVVVTSGWQPKSFYLDIDHPLHYDKVDMVIVGPQGGFCTYAIMEPEEAWLLAVQIIDKVEEIVERQKT